ncbi:MAG: HyaD/HybD family hydrogenase maturation endopeptidase [Desulfobulbaceae bacterium]
MKKNDRIGILGIGNLLMRDEGFGVHFIDYLTDRFEIPDSIAVLDGGTAGIMLAPFIEDVDILYVIDTVKLEDTPGAIHRFSDEEVRSGSVQMRMSPHQVGLIDILAMCRLREKAPRSVEMITVVPADLEVGIGLSPALEPKLREVGDLLADSLARRGILLQPAPDVTRA